jgi:ornithine cyclodeaminase
MRIIDLETIRRVLPRIDLMPAIEAGFAAYSRDEAVVPPVGELLFEDPPGEVHVKYGYLKNDEYYVVKVASGFYLNPGLGLPSGNGLMLLFSRRTGALRSVLLDEGYLTDVRTAVAGAVAARYLAPGRIECIGIVGTGTQARLQLQYLRPVTECRRALVWGRSLQKLDRYRDDMAHAGFDIGTTCEMAEVGSACNLIVTATAATAPLLLDRHVRAGTHITAVGSDASYKQELDAAILGRADRVVADSFAQCRERGEIAHALRAGLIDAERVVELGAVISGAVNGRTSDAQITVADLTGVAVQDIQIAKAVFEAQSDAPKAGVPGKA